MMQESLLLIVDYNLSRIGDVAHLAHYARSAYDAGTVLVRSSPSEADTRLCDIVIDLDPLSPHFVEDALAALAPLRKRLRAGLVFSDNAVQSGASLLERLGLPVDSSRLAIAAYSKCEYRRKEAEVRELLEAQAMMVPDCAQVLGVEDVKRFASEHPAGFVIKPSCEGNNRGVVVVREGDCVEDAFRQVEPYLGNGVICEEFIPFSREFSFDGVGAVHFVTKSRSVTTASVPQWSSRTGAREA